MQPDFITDEEMMKLEQRGIADTSELPDFIPDEEAPNFFAETAAPVPSTFKYSTLPTAADRAAKIANLQAEARVAEEASRKANSVGGKAKAFGGAFVKSLFGSEVGLGKTIAAEIGAGKAAKTVTEIAEQTADQKIKLIKLIREKKARGEDTSRLERTYNDVYGENVPLLTVKDLLPAIDKKTSKVVGELGGTALDILTAGTYGKETKVMQSGKLASKTNAIVGETIANHLKSTDQIIKNLPPERVAQMGGIPEILKHTRTNIVDQLRKQGLTEAANTIAKINPAAYSTFGAYTEAISKAAPSIGAVKTTLSTLFPELGKISRQKASGLFTAKGLANVGKGAGIGYGYDVTQGLQGARGEKREDGKAFIPGAGTIVGASIPIINESVQTVKNLRNPDFKAQKLADARTKELDKLDTYEGIRKTLEKGKERGINPKEIVSQTDVLHGAVDNTGTVHTKGEGGAIDQYTRQYIDPNEGIVRKALEKEGRSETVEQITKRLNDAVDKSGMEGAELVAAKKKVASEVAGYKLRANADGKIPLTVLHDAKVSKYNNINFLTEAEKQRYEKSIAKELKKMVEDGTDSIDVREVNRELSKHFSVIEYLDKLNNKKVEGGRLGKYFARTIGAIVGAHFGPIGSIIGAEAAAGIKGNQMAATFAGKTGRVIPEAEVLLKARDYVKAPRLQLPAPKPGSPRIQLESGPTINLPRKNPVDQSVIDADYSRSLGNRKINQSNTIIPKIKGISTSIPPKKGYLASAKENLKNPKNNQGGFIALPTLHRTIAKRIDTTDRNIMVEFVDMVTSGKKLATLSKQAQDLADAMQLPKRMAGNKTLAEEFRKILDIDREINKKKMS